MISSDFTVPDNFFILCQIGLIFIHVLECIIKNIHAKFGSNRWCNKFSKSFFSLELGKSIVMWNVIL